MSRLSVYVASPYDNACFVREHLHERLRALGLEPRSSWAEQARGREDLESMTTEAIRLMAAQNDADMRGSAVVLLVDFDGSGRETYAEARMAISLGKPLLWVGRPALSAFREGVVRVEDLDAAMRLLVTMKGKHEQGYRGRMLAELVKGTAA